MKNSTLRTGIPLIALTVLGMGSLSAATVSHWRFGDDGDALANSGTSGADLTQNGGTFGTESNPFPDPVPGTGDSNAGYYQSTSTSSHLQATGVWGASAPTSWTAEVYFSPTGFASGTSYIMGQMTGNRTWALGIAAAGGTGAAGGRELFLLASGTGSSSSIIPISLGTSLTLNDAYYMALVYDGTTDTNDVTLYLQNLTAGTALEVFTASSGFMTTNSAAMVTNPFQIAREGRSDQNSAVGYYDEIRLSDVALSQSELLIIPEPSTTMLAGGLAVLLTGVRRRQRCA